MAKRKSTASRRTASPAELAKKIEAMDRDLVKLINERAKIGERLAKAKQAAGEPLYDPAEEDAVVESFVGKNKGPLQDLTLRSICREMIGGTRSLVKRHRVAYLGPKFSYSHIAAVERFGNSADLIPVGTIAAVFEEINRRQVDFGLVPIENSTDGRVIDTLSMFAKLPAKISGEVKLRIRHNLLGKCSYEEVREVYSKPQALSQCRKWLARRLPTARIVEMTSTTAAAKLAAEREGAAAIASRQASVHYGLNIIAPDIQDSANNTTRFAVIGDTSGKRTGNDKTAIMFEVPHKPGSLADTMAIFKKNKLNLTWIESFPQPDTPDEYLFFVEFEGHENEAAVKRTAEALAKKATRLDVLGSYAQSETIE